MTMTKNTQESAELRALDTLTEKNESFEIKGKDGETVTLYLYPLQLGRLAMISRLLIGLDLVFADEHIEDAVKRMWTVSVSYTHLKLPTT